MIADAAALAAAVVPAIATAMIPVMFVRGITRPGWDSHDESRCVACMLGPGSESAGQEPRR